MINYHLNSKHALVCGASKGIGRATAVKLARSGATVTALARSEDSLNDLMAERNQQRPAGAQAQAQSQQPRMKVLAQLTTNMLIISGSREQVLEAKDLIAQLAQ